MDAQETPTPAIDYRERVRTYHLFVKAVMIFTAHVFVILALMGYLLT